MASCSTSSIQIQKSFKYDVFMSFRGEDTRTNFVDHLYHAFQNKGIHTYKDDQKIRKGKNISDELIGSIEDSRFYIIVFSKTYASSSWCLDELVKIMECQRTNEHTAYPVFYDVEPSEVRKQKGAVAAAFAIHEKDESAGKWREAMKEAADLGGWELKKTADGHEATFIKIIVKDLSLQLHSISSNTDKKLVGMDTRINDVVTSLGTGCNDVRMIGIKGMGGGGKTTLARAAFDQLSNQFEGKSFVENVRENASASGLMSLQKQVLSHVLHEDIDVCSDPEVKHMMTTMMRDKKVLVVLDDVDHIDQLEALAGERNWFKPGSRIIITTRDKQVLLAHGVKLICDVSLLSGMEAICLFNRYAFGGELPVQGYEELSKQVVRYAAGLPLTIKVLGSSLCGKSYREWEDALERLKTIPVTETQKKLELSFSGLDDDYKEIFLDIACNLRGWEKYHVIRALESCGLHARIGLKVLEQKSLITINHYSNDHVLVGMHDQLQEMGRNIVRRSHPYKPHKHSRLWKIDEIEEILANDLGTKTTRCIQFHTNLYIFMKGLRKMKELRFLSVVGDCLNTVECSIAGPYFPNALRYLRWHRYPFRCLPESFQADNLVALEMDGSSIEQLWEGGEIKVLNKLRFLDLSYSRLSTFDLGLTPNLETLTLQKCNDLVDIRMTIHCLKLISIDLTHSRLSTLDLGLAPNLEELILAECNHLERLHLPGRFLNLRRLLLTDSKFTFRYFKFKIKGRTSCSVDEWLEARPLAELRLYVESLKTCQLHSDNNLPKFLIDCVYKEDRPSLTRNLEMLISVGMSAFTNLETISRSICGLQHLRKMELKGSFLEVIKDLDQLECLEELIFESTDINHLPDSIYRLRHLKSLKLDDFRLLERLPDDLHRLECLEKLTLSCRNIKCLPDSICMLKSLKSLKLNCCLLLEKLPEDLGQLECLEELSLLMCESLEDIPNSICQMKSLKYFHLWSCIRVENLPQQLGLLACLENLDIRGTSIRNLPQSISLLKGLCIYGSRGILESCGFTSQIHTNEYNVTSCYVMQTPTAGVSST